MRAAVITGVSGLLLASAPGVYVMHALSRGDQSALSPGPATAGHALMETACADCHHRNDGNNGNDRNGGDIQSACLRCHAADLEAADDSHPAGLFDDPVYGDLRARLDASRCATCHTEHRPQLVNAWRPDLRFTHAQSVTVARDFCIVCHEDVLRERKTHAGMSASSCAAVGCHHYHDNRALHEGHLRAHAAEPPLLKTRVLPARDQTAVEGPRRPPPNGDELDALAVVPAGASAVDSAVIATARADWIASAHAHNRVGCAACHQPRKQVAWKWKPDPGVCGDCHGFESATFSQGKHGLRPAVGLPPLRPENARLPMKTEALARYELGCSTCHTDHRFDVRLAAVEACESCHDDAHTRAYRSSPHFALWQREQRGELPEGSGVSCASCHLPRTVDRRTKREVNVDHHQNRTLRPRDKMARQVCGPCHGQPFVLASLADEMLVSRNFQGSPDGARTGFDLIARGVSAQGETQ